MKSRARGVGKPWVLATGSAVFVPLVLRMAGWSAPLLRAAGLDAGRTLDLLRLRLALDLRAERRAERGGVHLGVVLIALLYWVGGVMLALPPLMGMALVPWAMLLSTAVLWMVAFALFAHYVNMLLEPTDIAALAPHPVRDGELFAARLLQLGAYVVVLGVALGCWPVLLAPIGYRSFAVLPAVAAVVALSALLALALAALGFALLLRLFGPERFQRLTLWLQVVFMSLAFGGGQALRGLVPVEWIERVLSEKPAALALLPPVQQAGLAELLTGHAEPRTFALAALALALPAGGLWLSVRLASRHFVAGLSGELSSGRARPAWPGGWFAWLGRRLRMDRLQHAGYGFLAAQLLRDRVLVRATLPPVLGMALMPAAMLLGLRRHVGSELALVPVATALSGLWLQLFAGWSCAATTQFGSTPEAAAFAETLPVRDARRYLGGALRAALLGFFLPVQLASLALVGALGRGWLGPFDLLLAALGVWAVLLAVVRRYPLALPLTRRAAHGNADPEAFALALGIAVAIALGTGAQLLLRLVPGGAAAGCALAAYALWRQRRALDEVPLR